MRALVLALALLAALKIWAHESAYRAATEEAIVAAYRVRAAEACARVSPLATVSSDHGALGWASGAAPRIAVGNPALPVYLWQIDHELWNARFRQPYLIFGDHAGGFSCTYDILAGTAEVSRT